MDRQSNGSFIVKDKIINTYHNVGLSNKENDDVVSQVNSNEEIVNTIKESKELKSLKTIDEKMMTIYEYLDDI